MTEFTTRKSTDARNKAVRELDLMREAIDNKKLKKALFHQKMAHAVIDEMMLSNSMVDELDLKYCS